ncbi:uncharacterized protein LOC100378318 [Saccoglossus kowalevskii]|uniref:LisH domain-containing protein C1711.05-like n=1 Tax=Saccoglossus kowalevskii TaxID=10224 RepID=A0ABM0MAI8_SACKO|nr:PREDICTED: lisH domain-containing protein C1711.05-like [Saccoglossus kowalevskii]
MATMEVPLSEKKPQKTKKKGHKHATPTIEELVGNYFGSMNSMSKRIMEEQAKCRYNNRRIWNKLDQAEKDSLIDQYFVIPQLTEAYEANCGVAEPGPDVFPKLNIVGGEREVQYTDEGSSSEAKTYKWKDEFSGPFCWETRSQLNVSLPTPDEDMAANLPRTPKPSEQDLMKYRAGDDHDETDGASEHSICTTSRYGQSSATGTPRSLGRLSFDFDFNTKASSEASLQFSFGGSEYDNVSATHSVDSGGSSSSRERLIEEAKAKPRDRTSSKETMDTSSSSGSSTQGHRVKNAKGEGYLPLKEENSQVKKTKSRESVKDEIYINEDIAQFNRPSSINSDLKAATLPATSVGEPAEFSFLTDW